MAVGVCASGRIGVGYARRASMDGTECDNYLHAGPEVRFLVISRSLQLFWPHTQWQGARSRRFFFNFFLSQTRALQLSSARVERTDRRVGRVIWRATSRWVHRGGHEGLGSFLQAGWCFVRIFRTGVIVGISSATRPNTARASGRVLRPCRNPYKRQPQKRIAGLGKNDHARPNPATRTMIKMTLHRGRNRGRNLSAYVDVSRNLKRR